MPTGLEVAERGICQRSEAECIRLDGLPDMRPGVGFIGVARSGTQDHQIDASHPIRQRVELRSGLVQVGHVHDVRLCGA